MAYVVNTIILLAMYTSMALTFVCEWLVKTARLAGACCRVVGRHVVAFVTPLIRQAIMVMPSLVLETVVSATAKILSVASSNILLVLLGSCLIAILLISVAAVLVYIVTMITIIWLLYNKYRRDWVKWNELNLLRELKGEPLSPWHFDDPRVSYSSFVYGTLHQKWFPVIDRVIARSKDLLRPYIHIEDATAFSCLPHVGVPDGHLLRGMWLDLAIAVSLKVGPITDENYDANKLVVYSETERLCRTEFQDVRKADILRFQPLVFEFCCLPSEDELAAEQRLGFAREAGYVRKRRDFVQ